MSYHKYSGDPASIGGTVDNAQNVGAGSQVFKQLSGSTLDFRTLVAGSGISLTQNVDTITITAAGDGMGDVTGPASSVNNALVRFDGTTGKMVKGSGAVLDNSNNLSGVVNLTLTGTTTLATSLTGVLKAVSGVVGASTLVNADVDVAAGINYSKLENIAAYSVVGRSTGTTGSAAPITAATNRILARASGNVEFIQLNNDMVPTNTLGYDRLVDASALSILGRSSNSSGANASISAGTDHFVLRRSGTTLGFGLLTNNNIDSAAAIAVSKLAAGSNGQVIETVAGVPTWVTPTAPTVDLLGYAQQTVTTNITLSSAVNYYTVNSASGARTLTVPAASSVSAGKSFIIKCLGDTQTNRVTLARTGADTIDTFAGDYILFTNGASIVLTSNGVNGWEVSQLNDQILTFQSDAMGAVTPSTPLNLQTVNLPQGDYHIEFRALVQSDVEGNAPTTTTLRYINNTIYTWSTQIFNSTTATMIKEEFQGIPMIEIFDNLFPYIFCQGYITTHRRLTGFAGGNVDFRINFISSNATTSSWDTYNITIKRLGR